MSEIILMGRKTQIKNDAKSEIKQVGTEEKAEYQVDWFNGTAKPFFMGTKNIL